MTTRLHLWRYTHVRDEGRFRAQFCIIHQGHHPHIPLDHTTPLHHSRLLLLSVCLSVCT
jgi:hypothetical protein